MKTKEKILKAQCIILDHMEYLLDFLTARKNKTIGKPLKTGKRESGDTICGATGYHYHEWGVFNYNNYRISEQHYIGVTTKNSGRMTENVYINLETKIDKKSVDITEEDLYTAMSMVLENLNLSKFFQYSSDGHLYDCHDVNKIILSLEILNECVEGSSMDFFFYLRDGSIETFRF